MPEWFERFLNRVKDSVGDDASEDLDEIAKEFEDEASSSNSPDDPTASDGGDADAGSDGLQAETLKEAMQPLQESIQGLQQALAEERQARKEAVNALEERQQEKKASKITQLLDKAVEEGRIESEKRETWKERLEKDYDTISDTIQDLPPAKKKADDGNREDGGEETPERDLSTLGADAKYLHYVKNGESPARRG